MYVSKKDEGLLFEILSVYKSRSSENAGRLAKDFIVFFDFNEVSGEQFDMVAVEASPLDLNRRFLIPKFCGEPNKVSGHELVQKIKGFRVDHSPKFSVGRLVEHVLKLSEQDPIHVVRGDGLIIANWAGRPDLFFARVMKRASQMARAISLSARAISLSTFFRFIFTPIVSGKGFCSLACWTILGFCLAHVDQVGFVFGPIETRLVVSQLTIDGYARSRIYI